MRRLFKYLSWVLVVLLFVLGAVLIVSQTQWFRDWVRDKIEEALSKELRAELRIGQLRGNLFTRAVVIRPSLTRGNRQVAAAASISASYDIFSLFSSPVTVDSIRVDSLAVHLFQNKDSVWIWDVLFAPQRDSTVAVEEPASDDGGGGVVLAGIRIERGSVTLSPLDTSTPLPRRAEHLSLTASLHVDGSGVRIPVETLSVVPDTIFPPVKHLSGDLLIAPDSILIRDVSLTTERNSIAGHATLDQTGKGESSFSLKTSPFEMSELRSLISLTDEGLQPAITAEGTLKNRNLRIRAHLVEDDGSLTVDGRIALGKNPPDYEAEIAFRNLQYPLKANMENIARAESGHLSIRGRGFDPASLQADFSARLDNAAILQRSIDQLVLSGHLDGGILRGHIATEGRGIESSVDITMSDLKGGIAFAANGDIHNFDLAPFLQKDELATDLNAMFAVEGSGLGLPPIELRGTAYLRPSSFTDIPIDTAMVRLGLKGDALSIDTAFARDEFLDIELSGGLSENRIVSVNALARIMNSGFLHDYIETDSLHGVGELSAALAGPIDSLNGTLRFRFRQLYGEGLSIDSAEGDIELADGLNIESLSGSAALSRITYGSVRLDELSLRGTSSEEGLHAALDFSTGERIGGNIAATISSDSVVSVHIEDIQVDIENESWTTPNDSALVQFTDDGVLVRRFGLSNGRQNISADGLIGSTGDSQLDVGLEEIETETLSRLFNLNPPVRGILHSTIAVRNALEALEVDASTEIQEMRIDTIYLGNLNAGIHLNPQVLTWDIALARAGENPFVTTGSIPAPGSGSGDSDTASKNEDRFIRFSTPGMDISRLTRFIPGIDTITGILTADFTASTSAGESTIKGFVRLNQGSLHSSEAGISFPSITIAMHGESTFLQVDTIRIESTEGSLTAAARFDLSELASDLRIKALAYSITADDFLLSNTRALELKLDGSLTARREADTVAVNGSFRVPRARIWLPSIMSGRSRGSASQPKPLLVAATEPADTVQKEEELAVRLVRRGVARGIRGSVRIDIPRNSWIQGRDLNIEISGTLDLLFEGSAAYLVGFIRIERGYYTLYGKKLYVKSGRLDFARGPKLDPSIMLEMSYEFRREGGEKDELILRITGKAFDPNLQFTVNNQPISEKDAVSYLLFGRSLDELSQSQKASFNQSTTDLVQGMASSVLSTKLASTLGASLGLDIIEVGFEDDWTRTYITAGKYLTDRLFVRYTSGIKSGGSTETRTDEVAIQYELLRFLELQLISGTSNTSGADIMFKFD